MTYYLTYRPQKIADLDLFSVREMLNRILSQKNIPHAFLFSGPRGAGKTSAARILAKAVNCTNPQKGGEPCNACPECLSISNGSSLDVIEIDAASNRGVDDIRSLRDGVKLATTGSKKKVYIIDEAHMLTNEASNALLKTLEEPPSHVLFVLATTNPGKLLDTIRSRCTQIVFPKATSEEIVASLQKAAKGEKLVVEKGVLEEIAQRVDGSFREAHKTLEHVALGREKITLKDIEEIFSVSSLSSDTLLRCMGKGETKKALEEVNSVATSGVDLKAYTTHILSSLRKILLVEFGVGSGSTMTAADFGGAERVREAIELFSQATKELPFAVIPQLPLELAVVKWGGEKGSGDGTVLTRLSGDSTPATGGTGSRHSAERLHALEPVSNTPELHSLAPAPSSLKEEAEGKEETGVKEEAEPKKGESPPAEKQIAKAEEPVFGGITEGSELDKKWQIVMKEVRPKNHSIEALLRATRPKSYDGATLVIEVFYQFHKERIEKDPCRSLVEETAGQVMGSPVKLTCLLTQQKQRAIDVVNITENVEDDIVRAAEDIFGIQTDDAMPN